MYCNVINSRTNQEEERFDALARRQEHSHHVTNETEPIVDSTFNLAVYTGSIWWMYIVWLVRGMLFMKVAYDASQKLHDTMFTRILRSPMRLFDTNPVGKYVLIIIQFCGTLF